MHILMATIDALNIPADGLVLNRSAIRQTRQRNRINRFVEAKTEFIEEVIRLYFSILYFIDLVCFVQIFFKYSIDKRLQ